MSPSVDTLLKIAAPQAKAAPSPAPREAAGEFGNYLREAAKPAATAEKPQTPEETPRTAPSPKEKTADIKGEEQGSTPYSEDQNAQAQQVGEHDEAITEEQAETAPQDEVLLSVAENALLIAQPEKLPVVAPSEATPVPAEPSNPQIALSAKQFHLETDAAAATVEAKTPAETEIGVTTAVDVIEQAPAVVSAETTEPSEVVAKPLPTTESEVANVETSQQEKIAPTVALVEAESRESESRDQNDAHAENSEKKPMPHKPLDVPQVPATEVIDPSADADNSNGTPTSVTGTTSPHPANAGNHPVSQSPTAIQSHTEGTEADAPTPTIDRARFVQRVANAFRSAQQNDGHIQLRLSPPELGSLRIEIAVRNGVLSANLEAETADARRVLLDNLPALRQRLAEQEIRIEKFEVDIRREGGQSDGQAGAEDRQSQQQSQRAAAQNRIPTPHTSEVVTARVPRSQQTTTDAGLDVRI